MRSESGAKIALNKARGGIGVTVDACIVGDDEEDDDDDDEVEDTGPGTDVGKSEGADFE